MYKIAFFCIPAHGHTNPTLEVTRELTARGHEVWYFSYLPFREKIEAAGGRFISCDPYEVDMNLKPEDAERVGKEIGFAIKLMVSTTLALDEMVCQTLSEWAPDCVVADSMAVWGKFAAWKLGFPFVSSTTTFAFNRYSAKVMKQSFSQMLAFLKAMPGVQREIRRLQEHGYPVKNVLSMIQNDNATDTIVYTSKEFQPRSETFSNRYVFVGPSIRQVEPAAEERRGETVYKTVYISMGTVDNRMPDFYRNCIEAFRDRGYHVVMSVGEGTDLGQLGDIPSDFTVQNHVDQVSVLSGTDVFLTHCGMNSVSEGLYYGVPLVLFPQTAEQGGVANRVLELQAGVRLEKNSAAAIRKAVDTVLQNSVYRRNAERIAESFRQAGGATAAADAVVRVIAGREDTMLI